MTGSKYEELRLGDLVSRLESGVSVRADDTPPDTGEIGVLKVSCLTGGRFNANESKRVPTDHIPSLTSSVRKGRVIISRSNTPELVGLCAYVPIDHPNLFLPDTLWQMEFSEEKESDPRWLAYLLNSPAYRAHLSRIASGTSANMKKLQKPSLLRLTIRVPPLPEQRKIAEILRTWDEAIERLETETTLKETAHSGYVKRLIHDPQYQRQRLRDHLQHVSHRNLAQKIERVLSVTNSAGFVLAEDRFAHRIASADLSNYKIVQRGQYAYNPARINVGSIARLDRWTDGVLSPMYVVFQVKPSLDSDFFYHWLFSAEARQRIRLAAQGSVRETVSFDDLGSIPLPVPPLHRQWAVARFLNESQREIELLRQLTQKYQRQKHDLMQKLLTGKWRVRVGHRRHG